MNFANMDNELRTHYRAMNAKNYVGTYYVLALPDGTVPMEVRFYCTNGGTVYCSVWFRINGQWGHGTARASGYGYNKESAALYCACKNAGVEFEPTESFHSCGMSMAMTVLTRGIEAATGKECRELHAYA